VIISHKHRFIFIKTEKTAGTSIEIALSKYCGPDDVITPISPEDEASRRELGFRCAQNYTIPPGRYTMLDRARVALGGKRPVFYNHARASFIRRYIDRDVWDTYFKFCFERNPWDKAVSLYYYRYKKEPRPAIGDFIRSKKLRSVRGYKLYTIKDRVVVDQVFKYEQIGNAMEQIRDRLGLDETPELVFAKRGLRQGLRNYCDILSDDNRAEIARLFAREIGMFGYEW
jgi:hypothetical protein